MGVDSCRLARQKVSPTLMRVVADMQTSILTHQETSENVSSAALVTKRRRFQQAGGTHLARWVQQQAGVKMIFCEKYSCYSTHQFHEEQTRTLKINTRF